MADKKPRLSKDITSIFTRNKKLYPSLYGLFLVKNWDLKSR